MRIVWISVLAVLPGVLHLHAEDAADQDANAARLRIKAAKLIEELGADDFGTREAAEKTLSGMGAPVFPQVKEALANTKDTEARARLDRVRKVLALEGETDPDQLAKIAREEALAKRYGTAAKYYGKAGALYGKQAEGETDEAKKKDWASKSEKSAKRKERAEGLAGQTDTIGENGERVIVKGNTRVVIRAQGGAGAGQIQINGMDVETEGQDEGGNGDW